MRSRPYVIRKQGLPHSSQINCSTDNGKGLNAKQNPILVPRRNVPER